MGYTHYWYRPKEVPKPAMKAIVEDFGKIVLALDDMGVRLADGLGEGVPVITEKEIYFNGLAACGHPENSEIVIPWPASGAGGVNAGSDPVAGTWFAGVKLRTRTCDGDCSYETVAFPRVLPKDDLFQPSDTHPGLYFSCCKTAYRPYDVAVTAFLLIAKHHLADKIAVSSDGEDEHWQDAKLLCYTHLGYGPEYVITDDGLQKRV